MKIGKINLKGLSANEIARVLILVITLINAVLNMCGLTPLDISNSDVYNLVSALAVVVSALWNCWKNFNVTEQAQIGQNLINNLKDKVVEMADLEEDEEESEEE